jgi:Zn-dependent peptidase ImmA (M78 family)
MLQNKLIAFCEQVVTYLLVKAGCHTLPIELNRLTRLLKVQEIETREMAAEGYVETVSNGYRIALKEGRRPQRTNFSLAHELAHIIMHELDHAEGAPLARQYRSVASVSGEADDEALADCIAGIILVPPWALSEVIPEDFSMPQVVKLAARANCSIATCLLRCMWQTTQSSIAFHARVYDDRPDSFNILWTRASRNLAPLTREQLLKQLGPKQFVDRVSGQRTQFAEHSFDHGTVDVYRRPFDQRDLIYALWKPRLPVTRRNWRGART